MVTQVNKHIARRILEELWGEGDLAVADELLAPDVVDHNSIPGMPPGRDGQKQAVQMFRAAFSQMKITVDELIVEGNLVVDRWTATMKHEGEFAGIPPTGRTVTITGMDISRIAGGKVVEIWHQEDILGLLRQLGVIQG